MEDPKKDPNRKTREQVYAMRRAGVSATRIGVALDISTTRVYQILESLRQEGKAV